MAQIAVAQMQLSHVTTDKAEVLHFGSSPANGIARFGRSGECWGKRWKESDSAGPWSKLLKEEGRSSVLDADTLAKLPEAAKQPLRVWL